MSIDTTLREDLADLCMAAQGFRPPRVRLEQLVAMGLLWTRPTKPSSFGMTERGRERFLALICEVSGADVGSVLAAARSLRPTLEEFDQGIASLDHLESIARTSEKLKFSYTQAAFTAWLLHQPQSVKVPES